MSEATTFDEFSALLLQQGVTVKESRGRLSYLTPDRTKPITARKLGDDFDRAAVLRRMAFPWFDRSFGWIVARLPSTMGRACRQGLRRGRLHHAIAMDASSIPL